MNQAESIDPDAEEDAARPRLPHRKSAGPGRERKQKARRASRRKQAGAAAAGIHRRGSKRRST